jgi:hypothetical protein
LSWARWLLVRKISNNAWNGCAPCPNEGLFRPVEKCSSSDERGAEPRPFQYLTRVKILVDE